MYGEIHGEKLMAENNLRSFIDHVGHIGIAKKDRYAISITGPSQTPWTGYIPSVQEVNMMCESISFPGQNIRSVPDTLRFGPAREHGQGITFGPFTAQFICSSDLREKMFFENWQNNIINERWEPNYYDNYTGSMLITQLDSWDRPTYQIEVVEAYPKTIMPQDMGYAQNNAYHTLGIEFTYRYWTPLILPTETMDEEDDWDPNSMKRANDGTGPPTREQKQAAAMRYVPDRMPGDVRTKKPGTSTAIWKAKEHRKNRYRRTQGLATRHRGGRLSVTT